MAPLVVQIVATILARALMRSWRDAIRTGLGIMFLFTAASHFSGMKHDLAAMIPPPFTGALWVIYLTGVMQIAGAIGVMISRTRRWAAWGLAAMLVGLFPANVYAAMVDVRLGGDPVTPLWIRTPLQLFWLALLIPTRVQQQPRNIGRGRCRRDNGRPAAGQLVMEQAPAQEVQDDEEQKGGDPDDASYVHPRRRTGRVLADCGRDAADESA
jgi:uncharacterized membrane protein